jgi:hypothetical protein
LLLLLLLQNIVTDASVSCITSVPNMPAVVAAGRVDGGLRIYDLRQPSRATATLLRDDTLAEAPGRAASAHSEWVVNLIGALPKGSYPSVTHQGHTVFHMHIRMVAWWVGMQRCTVGRENNC